MTVVNILSIIKLMDINNNNRNNSTGNSHINLTGSGQQSPQSQMPPQAKNSNAKKTLIIVLIIALFLGSNYGAFYIGKQNKDATKTLEVAVTQKPINLPKEATLLNECAIGRGKQYAIPKDLPAGPIYDVRGSEVIAIEYVLGIQALFADANKFSDTLMALIKENPVDHFDIIQQQPKAGDTDQMISLVMFVVPKEESAKITCPDTATPTTSPTTSPTTTPATPSSPAATPQQPAAPANPAQ